MKQLIFIFLLCITAYSFGQKKMKLRATSIYFMLENTLAINNNYRLYDSESKSHVSWQKDGPLNRLSYGIGLNRNFSKSLAIEFNAIYGAINNHNFYKNEEHKIDGITYDFEDTHFITGKYFRCDLNLKKFKDNAPFGFYYSLGVSYSHLLNKVSRSTIIRRPSYTVAHSTFGSGKISNQLFNFSFGLGQSKVISNSVVLDFGLKIHTLYFIIPETEFNFNYLHNFFKYNQILPGFSTENVRYINKASFNKEWLKVYIRIGLQNLKT